jgi:hypothetical protein
MAAPSRHRVVPSAYAALPVSMAVTAGAMLFSPGQRLLLVCLLVGEGIAYGMQWARPRFVVADDDGYAVVVQRAERFRVRWTEVQKVRHEPKEPAVYVDCGEPARNLLVPPRRGFGFHVTDAATLCARVLASVPADKVETVERLEKPAEPEEPEEPVTP